MSAFRPSRLIVAGVMLALSVLGPAAPAVASAAGPRAVSVLPPTGGNSVNCRLMDPDAPGLG